MGVPEGMQPEGDQWIEHDVTRDAFDGPDFTGLHTPEVKAALIQNYANAADTWSKGVGQGMLTILGLGQQDGQ